VTTKIALLDDYQGVAMSAAAWRSIPDSRVVAFHERIQGVDALAKALADFEVVVAMRERTPFPAPIFRSLPHLRLLVTTGSRNASIDIAAANAAGVTVCATDGPTERSWAAAELAWGLVIALARSIPQEDAALRRGGWQKTLGIGLAGRTLGVIGLGHLGAKVAEYGHAFGMRVLAWSPNLTPETAIHRGALFVQKDELLREADVVTIHLVLGPRSEGLIGERELRLMKPTAYLVNTSRGPIVDEAALVRALHEGRIAGVGLDVYAQEPLPLDSPLRNAPRTVLTPHLGYVTEESYRGFFQGAVRVIEAFLANRPIHLLPPQGRQET
jgi:phosphoglycerate dehydrogenase-like enzyme